MKLFLMLLNASHDPVEFTLPEQVTQRRAVVMDTANEHGFVEPETGCSAGEKLPLPEHSFVLLRRMA